MADTLIHRGPDSDGYWHDRETGIALAQRRLAILDLSTAGAQPMTSASGRYVITFNGEIYNHQDLRAALEAASGAPEWRGHSDTETLLAAIEQWGLVGSLTRLCGMFAFALWDRQQRELVLCRDRMGEKPLYVGWVNRTLVFGSELKALRAHPGFDTEIDAASVSAFLRYCYVPCPFTIYKHARKLPPGSFLRVSDLDQAQRAVPEQYWSLDAVIHAAETQPVSTSYPEAIEHLEKLLGDVVESHMLSDVPLGVFLSGGIDSSLVASVMQQRATGKVKTFSIGFEESRFSEAESARKIARHLGTEHAEFVVKESDSLSLIPDLPKIFDEPFADASQLPTILLSRLTRRSVTVALSGDGGDEMFGGYNRYLHGPSLWRTVGRVPRVLRQGVAHVSGWAQQTLTGPAAGPLTSVATKLGLPITVIDRLAKLGSAIGYARDFDDFYRELASTWSSPEDIVRFPDDAAEYSTELYSLSAKNRPAERMMALDATRFLPDDALVKVDRSAMSASLETRAPFLDTRIVEHAWRLPLSMKIDGRTGKRILQDVLCRHVPKRLIDRPKQGFAVPIDMWLRGKLKDWAEHLLSPAMLNRHDLLKSDAIQEVWQRHLAGKDNSGTKLWAVLMLQAWLEDNA